MPHLKLLTALTALVLLTACGGASPTATGDSAQTTDCAANPFAASCIAEDIGAPMRLTACLADIAINPLCTGDAGIATLFCEDNPFDTRPACTADTYFPDRVADCITDGNAGIARCNNLFTASASNTCLTNPFTDACTSDTEFDDYADMARVNRVSFCGISGNAGNTLCTALTICQTNPFHASCGAYFESAKNPYCGNNPTSTSCVNTTVWVGSFTGNEALPTTPDATNRKNQFLQATATGFASGATNGIRKPITPPIAVEIGTVKFADADTATGGAAFFNGGVYNDSDERLGTGRFFYAGILAGTNLGAPITETITSVRWTGQIRADSSESGAILSENPTAGFGVDITFDGAEGTIEETFVSTGSFVYSIDGMFDENGIITGTIEYGQVTEAGGDVKRNRHHFYSPGTLSGIIGQNGAVGVFHSDNANPAAGSIAALFSGGFVVTPPDPCIALGNCPVNTAAWLGSFTGGEALPTTPDTATRKSQFLQATPTGFADGANTNIRETFGVQRQDIAIQTLTFANTDTATGGVAFFGGTLYNSGESTGTHFYYAGILAGTNLGAPITETITSAKWTGKIRAISSVGEAQRTADDDADIELDITFDATRETKGTMTTFLKTVPTSAYSIDGTFDDKGIISGDIYFGYTTGEGASEVIDTDGALYSPGTLSGIIGQNGAVGVFHSDNGNPEAGQNAPSYSGGFFVTPPE